MKNSTTAIRIALLAAAAAACAWATPTASAEPTQADLGQPAQLGAGSDAQRWTVSALRPSSDALPYQPLGKLWEATATGQLGGGGIPVIPGFTARSGAAAYPVLWGVASPQGINPASLPPGGAATGKIYFDVTAGSPNAVVYTADGQDIAVWVQPTPPPAAGGMPYSPPRAAAPAPASVPAAPAPAAPAAPAPAPAATGSSGTPLPATGSSGTPLPAEGTTTTPTPSPAAATPTAPATTATPAPASTTPAAPESTTSAPPAASTPAPTSPAPASATVTPPPTSTTPAG